MPEGDNVNYIAYEFEALNGDRVQAPTQLCRDADHSRASKRRE